MTIAMTFVAVLVTGITLSISTCMNVWRRSQEAGELNAEARAVNELVSRDLRGAYLGLHRRGGYFFGGGSEEVMEGDRALLELTTESSALARAALLPREERTAEFEQLVPPVTDFAAVRYELREPREEAPGGLYRLTWVAPKSDWTQQEVLESEAASIELVSEDVIDFRLEYYDGENWAGGWTTSEDNLRLPAAVAMEFTLVDAREDEHVYQSIIPIPTH